LEIVVAAGQAGEVLHAVGGHQTGVFPRRGKLAVLGAHRPAAGQQTGEARALVDHRLDGEGHPRLQHHALARPAVVQDLRVLVVDLADAVAAVLAHHAEALAFGVFLDRVADVAQGRARTDRPDPAEQRLAGGLDQTPGHARGSAHVTPAPGTPVPA